MKTILPFLFAFVLLMGCIDESADNPIAPVPTQNGNISLSFNKAAIPHDVASISVVMSRQGYDSLKRTIVVAEDTMAEVLFENIPVGRWNIAINAYGSDHQVKYSGFTDVMINDGSVTNVSMTLQPVTTGVGSVLITVSWGSIPGVTGVAHWWTGDSTANDQRGTSHGILQNGASFAPGIFRQAFAFDGNDDVVTVTDPNVNYDSSSFSISVWVKANTFAEYSTIISKRGESGNWQGWWLGRTLELGGVWRFEYGRVGNTANLYSDVHAVTGAFVHITVVVNRTEQIAQLYINGSLQPNLNGQSSTKTVGTVNSNDPLRIGRGALNANTGNFVPWNGLIDHVKIFDKALTKEEVLQNFYSVY